VLSGQAIRGVALGVVVTALVQALVGGIGLAIAHVPFAAVLTAVMFLLAVAQIGAAPVMIIAVACSIGRARRLGHVPARRHHCCRHPGQFSASILIKKGRTCAAPHLCGVIGGLIASV